MNSSLSQALATVQAYRAKLAQSVDAGKVERKDGELVIKGIDLALSVMRSYSEDVMRIERFDIINDPNISRISYCAELQTLEVLFTNGVVRSHRGVDSNRWLMVKNEEDLISGYYSHIWDKLAYDEQRP